MTINTSIHNINRDRTTGHVVGDGRSNPIKARARNARRQAKHKLNVAARASLNQSRGKMQAQAYHEALKALSLGTAT